jgi:hypothetical protein
MIEVMKSIFAIFSEGVKKECGKAYSDGNSLCRWVDLAHMAALAALGVWQPSVRGTDPLCIRGVVCCYGGLKVERFQTRQLFRPVGHS